MCTRMVVLTGSHTGTHRHAKRSRQQKRENGFMAELIAFPSGPDLIEAKAKASKRVGEEQSLYRLARFYVKMNNITNERDVFKENGRVARTALEFIDKVCETIGYYKPEQIAPQEIA